MKRFLGNILLAICFCMSVISFSSCLGDDGNDSSQKVLTHSEKALYVQAVSGSYTGKLYYYPDYNYENSSSSYKADSVSMSWNASVMADTLGTCYSFSYPVSVIGKYSVLISDATTREILKAAAPQKFVSILVPIYYSDSYYTFYMLPNIDGKAATSSSSALQQLSYTVTYNGSDHNVILYFANYFGSTSSYYSSQYPVVVYLPSTHQFVGTILLSKVVVDGKSFDLLATQTISATKQ